jgi:hypothetical protein
LRSCYRFVPHDLSLRFIHAFRCTASGWLRCSSHVARRRSSTRLWNPSSSSMGYPATSAESVGWLCAYRGRRGADCARQKLVISDAAMRGVGAKPAVSSCTRATKVRSVVSTALRRTRCAAVRTSVQAWNGQSLLVLATNRRDAYSCGVILVGSSSPCVAFRVVMERRRSMHIFQG